MLRAGKKQCPRTCAPQPAIKKRPPPTAAQQATTHRPPAPTGAQQKHLQKRNPNLSAFSARFSNGFSGGKKLVACFLKLVARISKSEPLIFSLLPCRVNTLKTNFQFSAPENGDFNGNKTVRNGGNDSNRTDVGNGNDRGGLIAPLQRRAPPGVCVRRDCSLLLSYRRATVWPVPLSPCS